jgi:hypothetical protein
LRVEGLDVTILDPINSRRRVGSASKLQFDFFPGRGPIQKAGLVFGGIGPVAYRRVVLPTYIALVMAEDGHKSSGDIGPPIQWSQYTGKTFLQVPASQLALDKC